MSHLPEFTEKDELFPKWKTFQTLPMEGQSITVWMYGEEWEMTWKEGPVPSFMEKWKPNLK